jgi:hypothetical protein
MATERRTVDKRGIVTVLAVIVIGLVIFSGLFVVTDIIQDLRPSNVRFDEKSQGQLYSRVMLNYSDSRNDLLVVKSSKDNEVTSISCLGVVEGFNVIALLENVGVVYNQFTYSVYGIVFKFGSSIDDSPKYRFLFQTSTMSKDSFYMTREVIPSYEYINAANVTIKMDNEGFSVSDVLDGINTVLGLPFM